MNHKQPSQALQDHDLQKWEAQQSEKLFRVVNPQKIPLQKIMKEAISEILNGKLEGFKTFDRCVKKNIPDDLEESSFHHFLLDFNQHYLPLLKKNYHVSKENRLTLKQSFYSLFKLFDEIVSIQGKELIHFNTKLKQIKAVCHTINNIRKKATYTIGDRSFHDLLDKIEMAKEQFQVRLTKNKTLSQECPNKVLGLDQLISQSPTSFIQRWKRVKQKTKDVSERERVMTLKTSGLSETYGEILNKYSEYLIQHNLDPDLNKSQVTEDFINQGEVTKDLEDLYSSSPSTNNKTTPINTKHTPRQNHGKPILFTNVTQWIELEVQNALELPYSRVLKEAHQLYHNLLKKLFSSYEKNDQNFQDNYSQTHKNEKLKLETYLLQDMFFHTASYEQELGKGRSASSVNKIREYSHLKSLQQKVLLDLIQEFGKLDLGSKFAEYIKRQQTIIKLLMVTKHHAFRLIQKGQRYLNQTVPLLKQHALAPDSQSGIPYRINQLLLETRHTIESIGPGHTFLPVIQQESLKIDHSTIEKALAKLEKYFPIFKKPLGSLKSAFPQAFNPEDLLNLQSEKTYEINLIKFEEQLNSYQLKSRETKILIIPSEGLGSYEPFTNTLIIPLVCNNAQNPLEGLYRAVASYLYRARIQNNPTALKELIDVLVSRYTNVKNRKHSERIIVNVFSKHLMEVTGLIHTSGHTQKEKKVIVSHLDHPNHLIQCREIINVTLEQRENCLSAIKTRLHLKKAEHMTDQLIQYIDPEGQMLIDESISHPQHLSNLIKSVKIKDEIKLSEDLFDLGVILFQKHQHYGALETFLILSHLTPESQEVWWNIATILNFHPFEGYIELVKDRKKAALNAYKKFEKADGVSEYWIKKSRLMAQELELKRC